MSGCTEWTAVGEGSTLYELNKAVGTMLPAGTPRPSDTNIELVQAAHSRIARLGGESGPGTMHWNLRTNLRVTGRGDGTETTWHDLNRIASNGLTTERGGEVRFCPACEEKRYARSGA